MSSASFIHPARSAALAVVWAAVTLCAASCVAPVGPGYTVERQRLEVAYVSSGQPHVNVRASWRLKNTGNQPLAAIELKVPEQEIYGLTKLAAVVDGNAVSTRAVAGGALGIRFEAPWAQNEKHQLVVEYEIEKQEPFRGLAMEGDAVILTGVEWYPALRPPKGTFARVKVEKPLELIVRVPEGFRAHSGGKARGRRKEEGNLVYRFRLRKENGHPFVVAGRFFEQRFSKDGVTILFWMLKAPWPEEQLDHAGARLADCLHAYENDFGPLAGAAEPYRVVALPNLPVVFVAGMPVFIAPEFVRGVVIPALQDTPEKVNNYSLTVAEYGLAESWFGTPARTQLGTFPVFNLSLFQYAAKFAYGETFGIKTERTASLRQTLKLFDHIARDPGAPKERPLAAIADNEERGERLQALSKSELFLAALEDKCGEDALRRAMRHLAGSLESTGYGYAELRSALEAECGADLGPLFRAWTTETGIPADFRRQYETAGSPATP